MNLKSKYKMLHINFLLILFLSIFACKKEEKKKEHICNDVFALNYTAESNTELGCLYQNYFRQPVLISDLANNVKETSGLATLGEYLLTHNDKGNSNDLFLLNKSNGNLIKKIEVINAVNNDWEDLAQNEDYIFIGDMGNNDGDRQDLGIYKIAKADFDNGNANSVEIIEKIEFYYPEQSNFESNKDHNFDCEAIVYHNNHLYLFTKHRADKRTNLYKIKASATGGKQKAQLINSFEVGGKITGADISDDGKKIVLLGYVKKADCFLWVLEDFINDNFLSGKKTKFTLGAYKVLGQTEGIVFNSENSVLISSEKKKEIPPRLYMVENI